jgi:hypothetical protein
MICTNVMPDMTEYAPPPVSVQTSFPNGIDVSGYSTVHEFSYNNSSQPKEWVGLDKADSLSVTMYVHDTITELRFIKGGNTIEKVSLAGLMQKISAMKQDGDMPENEMTLTGTGILQPRIIVKSADVAPPGLMNDNNATLMNMEMWILLK